jgi:hypothetical protein
VASVRHSLTAREAAKPLEFLMRRDFLQRAFPELKDRAKLMPTLRVEPLPISSNKVVINAKLSVLINRPETTTLKKRTLTEPGGNNSEQ